MQAAMRAQMEEMFGGQLPPQALEQMGGLDYSISMEQVVITDPTTLRPHRLTQMVHTNVSMPGMGQSMNQKQITETVFSWR